MYASLDKNALTVHNVNLFAQVNINMCEIGNVTILMRKAIKMLHIQIARLFYLKYVRISNYRMITKCNKLEIFAEGFTFK